MSDCDFVELVWENGQIIIQVLSSTKPCMLFLLENVTTRKLIFPDKNLGANCNFVAKKNFYR